ncbi:MAG: TolC family protein, partial [Rubrivivax sp.]|nr:TolC family protein [Rubrivivax sp.]
MTRSLLLAAGAGLALSGCGLLAPPVAMPPQTLPQAQAPAAWYAPLPAAAPQPPAPAVAESARAAALRQWWQQFDDPVLVALIDAGQAASPTIAAAASRIEQARAASTAADAALIPFVNAQGGASVASRNLILPGMTNASLSVQAGWEIDLFGAGRARADAAAARLEASEAGWHDARIAVAAETGSTYNTLRGCEALVVQTEADVRSREETARVTTLAVQAGMMAPASGALARASAAQGRSLLAAQRAQCEQLVKALVALTALDEPAL